MAGSRDGSARPARLLLFHQAGLNPAYNKSHKAKGGWENETL
jgi:hypothetical protein